MDTNPVRRLLRQKTVSGMDEIDRETSSFWPISNKLIFGVNGVLYEWRYDVPQMDEPNRPEQFEFRRVGDDNFLPWPLGLAAPKEVEEHFFGALIKHDW